MPRAPGGLSWFCPHALWDTEVLTKQKVMAGQCKSVPLSLESKVSLESLGRGHSETTLGCSHNESKRIPGLAFRGLLLGCSARVAMTPFDFPATSDDALHRGALSEY